MYLLIIITRYLIREYRGRVFRVRSNDVVRAKRTDRTQRRISKRSMREENCDLENSPRAGSMARMVHEAIVRGCLSTTILSYWFCARPRRGVEECDRDEGPWHQYRAQQANPRGSADGDDGVAAPRMTVRSVSTHSPGYPPLVEAISTWRCASKTVEAESLLISLLLSLAIPAICHFASSRRNIWPGRPEVSYWRNMAQSCEIFPLEVFSPPATYI